MELSNINALGEKDKSANNEIPLHNCVDIITIIPDANFLPEDGEAEYHDVTDQTSESFEYYYCKHCDFHNSNKHTVLTHLNSHASRQTNRCRLCGFTAPYHKTVLKHVELCHRGGAEDVQRGIKFMQNNNILQLIGVRLKKGLTTNLHSRNICESKSPFEESVAAQVKMRHSESRMRKIRCEHCSYISKSTVDMSYHKHFHKPNALAPYHCPHCSFWAVETIAFNNHLKLHNQHTFGTEKDVTAELNSNEGSSDNSREIVDNKETIDSTEQDVIRISSIAEKEHGNSCDSTSKYSFTESDDTWTSDDKEHRTVCGKDRNTNAQRIECGTFEKSTAVTSSPVIRQCVIKKEHFSQVESPKDNKFPEEKFFTKGETVKTFHCYRCPAYFTEELELKDHSSYHGASLTYSCPYCDYRAGYAIYLKHLEVHISEFISELKKLSMADKKKKRLCNIESENSSVHDIDYWENKETIMLANKSGFFANKIRKHYCSLCPAAFSRKRILLYHSSLHDSTGTYSCSKCGYATNKSVNIVNHLSLHYCVEENSYACPKCPLIYYHEEKFIYHLSFHGKKGRFCCNICDYASCSKSKIQYHKKLHKQLLSLQDMVSSLYDLMENTLSSEPKDKTVGNGQNAFQMYSEKVPIKDDHACKSETISEETLHRISEKYMKEDSDNEEEETAEGYNVPMEDALEVVIKEEPADESYSEPYESSSWDHYESILPD